MAKCERCETLNGILQRERKELAALKDRCATLDKRARDRKKQVDDMMRGQTDAARAVERAISAVIGHVFFVTKPNSEVYQYFHSHSQKLRNVARESLESLDAFKKDDSVHKKIANRKRSEHAMPRHGKYSS